MRTLTNVNVCSMGMRGFRGLESSHSALSFTFLAGQTQAIRRGAGIPERSLQSFRRRSVFPE
jgi:hypothetical protein